MMWWSWFIRWLGQRRTIRLLFIVNLFGTIYGYYWYRNQLLHTEIYLWPFVPDSPTASLFFTIVLFGYLLGRKWPLLEAFAAVTLVKYGVWATVMIIWAGALGAPLSWEHYMLIFSHLGMAFQAVLFSRYFTFRVMHLGLAAFWTLLNDVMDYSLGIFPWVNERLHPHLPVIAAFTVSLSMLSVLLFYSFSKMNFTRTKVERN